MGLWSKISKGGVTRRMLLNISINQNETELCPSSVYLNKALAFLTIMKSCLS